MALEGEYEEVEELGRGTYGRVVLSRGRNGERVVVKKVDLEWLPQEDREAAAMEANHLARADSSNVVRCYGSFSQGQTLCTVMEYCPNGSVEALIASSRELLPERTIRRVFCQSAQGLSHLHGQGILHRDVKPSNILLDSSYTAKLADLGIAKAVPLAKTLIGTPYYLSPEALDGQPYGPKADVWGLGVVLFQLMSKRLPFKGNNQGELFLKILRANYSRPTGSYSRDLFRALDACLQASPSMRPTADKCASMVPSERPKWTSPSHQPEPSVRARPKSSSPPPLQSFQRAQALGNDRDARKPASPHWIMNAPHVRQQQQRQQQNNKGEQLRMVRKGGGAIVSVPCRPTSARRKSERVPRVIPGEQAKVRNLPDDPAAPLKEAQARAEVLNLEEGPESSAGDGESFPAVESEGPLEFCFGGSEVPVEWRVTSHQEESTDNDGVRKGDLEAVFSQGAQLMGESEFAELCDALRQQYLGLDLKEAGSILERVLQKRCFDAVPLAIKALALQERPQRAVPTTLPPAQAK